MLAAAALTGALAACERDPNEASPAPAQSAYDVALRAKGAQLAAQDRANAARHRAEIARVVTGSARDVTPPNAMTERFVLRISNHGSRTLRRIDGGVIVYGGRELHRLGLASFSAGIDIPPGRNADVRVAIPLTAFAAEGAGALARASAVTKRVELELTGYRLETEGARREAD